VSDVSVYDIATLSTRKCGSRHVEVEVEVEVKVSALTCAVPPRFYERQGFVKIDDFVVDRKDGSKWPGTFFKMELGE